MELYAEDFVSRRFLNRLLKQQTIQVNKGKKKTQNSKEKLRRKMNRNDCHRRFILILINRRCFAAHINDSYFCDGR